MTDDPNPIQFLMRVPLRGDEVPAFNALIQALREVSDKEARDE